MKVWYTGNNLCRFLRSLKSYKFSIKFWIFLNALPIISFFKNLWSLSFEKLLYVCMSSKLFKNQHSMKGRKKKMSERSIWSEWKLHNTVAVVNNLFDMARTHKPVFLLILFEPCHKKTCLRVFWPSKTQTSLLSNRSKLESLNCKCRN